MFKAIEKGALLKVIQGEIGQRPPVWFMRQAGRHLPEYMAVSKRVGGIEGILKDEDLVTSVTLQPVERYSLDAAVIFSDILLMHRAAGYEVTYENGARVIPKEAIVPGKADLSAFENTFKAIKQVRANLNPSVDVLGFIPSVWTSICYAIDGSPQKLNGFSRFPKAERLAIERPELVDEMVGYYMDLAIKVLNLQIEYGASIVQVFNVASAGLTKELFERFSIEPSRKLVKAVKGPVIYYSRGSSMDSKKNLVKAGIKCLGVDETVSLDELRELSLISPVQGNLDQNLLIEGDQEKLRQATTSLLEAMRGRPHIFNLGHGIPPQANPENVKQIVDQVRAFR